MLIYHSLHFCFRLRLKYFIKRLNNIFINRIYKVQTEQLSYVIIYIQVNNLLAMIVIIVLKIKYSSNILTIQFVVFIVTVWILNYVDIVLMIFN